MKNQEKANVAGIWLVFLLACILRFAPGVLAGFPINDGGLFLRMILDLQANGFNLPPVTSYNFSNIPFAYPPFGFYLAGSLSSLFLISVVDLLRWLPPLVSTSIIPIFYWFSLRMTGSTTKAFFATALYAVIPGISDWLVMGGGLTRSSGILFLLLSLVFAHKLFCEGGIRNFWLSVLFCSLTVLSHPEAGLQIVALCLLLWLFYGRSYTGLKQAFALSVGVGSLTAMWWLTILLSHGYSPFLSAMQTGVRETLLASLFHTFFSYQGALPILPVLSSIGIFIAIRNRNFLPVAFAFSPFVVDPRNAPAVAIFPLLLLAAEGLDFLKVQYTRSLSANPPVKNSHQMREIPKILFVILLSYLFYTSMSAAKNLANLSLTLDDRKTMEWVKLNTPADSRFLLITNTGNISPTADPFQEWFPSLASRKSLNTIQGLEWTEGSRFYEYSRELIALQTCPDVSCLNQWLEKEELQTDYYLFLKNRSSPELINSLRSGSVYMVGYESSNVVIFGISQ
jgi:hypothetical protein